MAWIVAVDHLTGDPDFAESAVGIGQYPDDPAVQLDPAAMRDRFPHSCKLYDDDGVLYYTVRFDDIAESDDEAYGGLYECYRWGMVYAGTTDLRIKGESIYG